MRNEAELKLLAKLEMIVGAIKDRLVKTRRVSGGKFSYYYMPLDELDPLVREQCVNLNLHLSYPAHGNHQGACITDLETGAEEVSLLPIALSNSIQDQGKFYTYNKRYALFNVLGIPGASDNDGVTSSKSKTSTKTVSTVQSSGSYGDLF